MTATPSLDLLLDRAHDAGWNVGWEQRETDGWWTVWLEQRDAVITCSRPTLDDAANDVLATFYTPTSEKRETATRPWTRKDDDA